MKVEFWEDSGKIKIKDGTSTILEDKVDNLNEDQLFSLSASETVEFTNFGDNYHFYLLEFGEKIEELKIVYK